MNIKTEAIEYFKEKFANSVFNASNIKLVFGELLPIPLADDNNNKSREYWQGMYHIFDHLGHLALYAYDSVTHNALFVESTLKVADFVIDNAPETVAKSQEEILKESRKKALSEKGFVNELGRIKDFIKDRGGVVDPDVQDDVAPVTQPIQEQKIEQPIQEQEIEQPKQDVQVASVPEKEANPKPKSRAVSLSDLERMDSEQRTTNLAILFENSQVLEDTLCSYAKLFSGITDEDLQGVRIVDQNIEVLDVYENPLYLKRGDILIKYADNENSNETYTVKSTYNNKCYDELYISSGGGLSNFKLFGSKIDEADKWVFIATDFLSANAIHSATGVKTVAVPNEADMVAIYNEIRANNPSVNIAVYRSESFESRLANHVYVINEGEQKIYNVYLDRSLKNWCDYREFLIGKLGEKAKAEFVSLLRLALSDAIGYVTNNKES